MAIPKNALFEEFIAKTKVVERPTGPAVSFSAGMGGPILYLEYPKNELSLEAMLRVVRRELAQQGSPVSPDIAVTVLGNIAVSRESNASAVEHANECLVEHHGADLHQYLVLPTPCRRDYEAVFGELRIRPFDPERLLYWARRGGSEYPIDLAGLAGKTSLERDLFSTRTVNWDGVWAKRKTFEAVRNELAFAAQDAYYAAVFEHHMSEVRGLLRRNLVVLEAGALVHVDVDSLLAVPWGHRIGLFHWLWEGRQRTWAVLSWVAALNINLVPPALLTDCRKWLRDSIGFVNLDLAKPLDKSIDTFCTLLQRAHDHRLNGRGNEAALHFVIALDFVFGMEGRSAESVADRAAVVTHRQFGRSMEDQARCVKRLYDARSKYVHLGQSIPPADIHEAEQAATHVLWALLRVSGAGVLLNTSQWLTKIDYVLAAIKDGRAVPETEFATLGLVEKDVNPPNRVREAAYGGIRVAASGAPSSTLGEYSSKGAGRGSEDIS